MKTNKIDRLIYIFMPFLIYILLKDIVATFLLILIQNMAAHNIDFGIWLSFNEASVNVIIIGISALIAVLPSFKAGTMHLSKELPRLNPVSENLDEELNREKPERKIFNSPLNITSILLLILSSAILSLIMTAVMNYSGLMSIFGYTNISGNGSVPVALQISILGLLTPVIEEIIFRLITYNRLSETIGATPAIICSGLLFGIYHGTIIQFIYASIMGIAFAFAYKKYEKISAPLLMHITANLVAIIIGCI